MNGAYNLYSTGYVIAVPTSLSDDERLWRFLYDIDIEEPEVGRIEEGEGGSPDYIEIEEGDDFEWDDDWDDEDYTEEY